MASTAASAAPTYMLPGVAVCQPAHLEGDSSLATEILPGPPSLLSVQQAGQKRDQKSSVVYSYLPASDPGTTYSGIVHGTLIGQESLEAIGKRTRVQKSAVTGRAQRASARNQPSQDQPVLSEQIPQPPPLTIYMDSECTIVHDTPTPSRADSAHIGADLVASSSTNGRPKRKDKGKGKDTDPSVKVKEEPSSVSLQSPEPPAVHALRNQDHCSSCRSQGSLVYCDGCPKAFHLWCLDPPIQKMDESDAKWFCPACTIRKHPPRKPPSSFISPLIHFVDTSIPTEYQLPSDIRNFYKDVNTGDRGAYVDASEIKQPRLNASRYGQVDDREPFRLKDRNGEPVLCFRCGTSAIPDNVAAAAPAAKRVRRVTAKASQHDHWKNIISCDYCDLHWHLDCLDPPLPSMPPFTKKWMCPNHAEQVLPQRHRIPKQNAPVIEITKPRQFNNGNIEVIPSQATSGSHSHKKTNIEEILINGRRYRVPERIILLDFWGKIDKTANGDDDSSSASSPLTSLSSLSELDENEPTDDLSIAQMLCDFSRGTHNSDYALPSTSTKKASSNSLNSNLLEIDDKLRRLWPSLKPPGRSTSTSAGPSTSTAKRKRSSANQSDSSARRSTRGTNGDMSASSSKSSSRLPEEDPAPPTTPRKVRVKTETDAPDLSRTKRAPRSRKSVPEDEPTGDDKPKRGKKRKEREEDGDYVAKGSAAAAGKSASSRRKSVRTPATVPDSPPAAASVSAPNPATPSLKIRLRLNPPSANADTSV